MKYASINRLPALDYQVTEALNTLCTNLSFVSPSIKKIMITSCRPEEGKSFMSINLMRALASLGRRVILVDADLRRSVMENPILKADLGIARLVHPFNRCTGDTVTQGQAYRTPRHRAPVIDS